MAAIAHRPPSTECFNGSLPGGGVPERVFLGLFCLASLPGALLPPLPLQFPERLGRHQPAAGPILFCGITIASPPIHNSISNNNKLLYTRLLVSAKTVIHLIQIFTFLFLIYSLLGPATLVITIIDRLEEPLVWIIANIRNTLKLLVSLYQPYPQYSPKITITIITTIH